MTLAGRPFRVRRGLLDDIAGQNLAGRIAELRKALLVFHSPTDDTVGIDNASHIFTAAKHPKSFISLAGADHLLLRPSDAAYVAHVIAAWAERYLDMPAQMAAPKRPSPRPSPARLSSAKRGTARFSKKSSPARIASWPTSRSQPAGSTAARDRTTCYWRRLAPARR